MEKKWLAVGIILLFIWAAAAAMAEPSAVSLIKAKQTKELRECSRDQTELHYYDGLYCTIGIMCGSQPHVWDSAIRFTQEELASYSTWNLTQVVIGFGEDPAQGPVNVTIIIYDKGTSRLPGPVIVNDTHTVLTGDGLLTVPLVTPVPLAGHDELWVAVVWYQKVGLSHYAYIDYGPAVYGKGDWIYLNNVWSELRPGLDNNWAMGAIVEGQNQAILTLGDIKGPRGITAELQNIGNWDAYNVTWTITVKGGLFGLVNKTAKGTYPLLPPHHIVNISLPSVFGLGKIWIDIVVQAKNAIKIEVTKSAFLIGPLVLGIK